MCNVHGARKVQSSSEHSHRYGRKQIVAKNYELDTMVSPSTLLARAKKAAHANGATLLGDEHSGRFSHELAKGEYRMVGRRIIVTVTDKHWLLPWSVVEVRLRELVL